MLKLQEYINRRNFRSPETTRVQTHHSNKRTIHYFNKRKNSLDQSSQVRGKLLSQKASRVQFQNQIGRKFLKRRKFLRRKIDISEGDTSIFDKPYDFATKSPRDSQFSRFTLKTQNTFKEFHSPVVKLQNFTENLGIQQGGQI